MKNFLILERHGQHVVFCLTTHELEVFETREQAEHYVNEQVTLEELNQLLISNLV